MGYFRLYRKDFESAASVIVATFPGELESIYFNFIPSDGPSSARGKLYQAYKSIRDQLSAAGMIQKRYLNVKSEEHI